ncbi:hypothetical protein D3C76_1228290 [compost metagenome]
MFAAWIDADVQRRLTAGGALGQRFAEIQLQRIIVAGVVLRLRNAGGKIEIVTQRMVCGQLLQTFGSAGIKALQVGEK